MLPEALHSNRSLLRTATNMTQHERMFNYNRRSSLGSSPLTWLSMPGNVLLKQHLRSSKNKPLVDEIELVHATPNYARIRLPSGRETTVSLRDVAPCGSRHDADPLLSDLICQSLHIITLIFQVTSLPQLHLRSQCLYQIMPVML